MSSSKSRVSKLLSGFCVSRVTTDRAIWHYLRALDSPRSLTAWLLYENKEYEQLVKLEIDPMNYDDTSKFADDYAATKFLSKYKSFETGIDKRKVALDGWKAAEERCRETNERMRDDKQWSAGKPANVWLHNATKQKIASILHDFVDPDEWLDACSWGPGATFHMKGDDTGPESKFLLEGGITHSLFPLVKRAFPTEYSSWIPGLELTRGNRVLTVDKNAKTDRVIAAEPGINLWFQKGIGNMIASRLRRRGIDIRSQDRNQLLAFYGSRAGNLATVDFSAASDTISYSVVEDLLPGDWFHALDLCRSPCSYVDGHWVELEKFSSMGNGFTFPLQTLIFFAAALAVCEYLSIGDEYVAVYGDDVIVPVEAYQQYVDFCDFLGFTVNMSKSYSSGLFRESCGAHYFYGTDVKPLYLKEALSNVSSLYKFANAIKRYCRRSFCFILDGRFYSCWNFLYQEAPRPLRFHVPKGYGDIGFEVGFDLAHPDTERSRFHVEGFTFYAVVDIPVRRATEHHGVLLARLTELSSNQNVFITRVSTTPKGNFRFLRRATRRVVKRVFANEWCDGGSWLFAKPPFKWVPA